MSLTPRTVSFATLPRVRGVTLCLAFFSRKGWKRFETAGLIGGMVSAQKRGGWCLARAIDAGGLLCDAHASSRTCAGCGLRVRSGEPRAE